MFGLLYIKQSVLQLLVGMGSKGSMEHFGFCVHSFFHLWDDSLLTLEVPPVQCLPNSGFFPKSPIYQTLFVKFISEAAIQMKATQLSHLTFRIWQECTCFLPILANVERAMRSIMGTRIQKLCNPSLECTHIQGLYAKFHVNFFLLVLQRSLLRCVSLEAENKEEADSD